MWIVIENFPIEELASIVINEDGTNKVFTSEKEAEKEAEDCQNGIVVELN